MKNRGLRFFWSIDNSVEFLLKLSGVPRAYSIKTYDFSTLYTNLPLDYIYECLEKLIIKMYNNSGAVGLLINADRKKAFWSQGCSYPGYKLYTIDKLLDALKYILYNTYVQFAGNVLKQTQGIPMGGNASPFIADLYLSWCEYCYVTNIVKKDYLLAKKLSYNCRYLDDICTVNLKGFGTIAKNIYDTTLLLEGSTSSYKWDNFLDLYIRIIDGKFVTGIYHKVDDFSFEVISFPFPDSNIHSALGHKTFYSQLIRFYKLCNNITDFLFRAKLIYNKLLSRGYEYKLLRKAFITFCQRFEVCTKFGETRYDKFFTMMVTFDNYVVWNVNDTDMNVWDIIKPCSVKLNQLTSFPSCKQKEPSASSQSVQVKKHDMCVRDLDGQKPNNLSSTAQLVVPNHVHPFGINNPNNHCYINSVLQYLYCIIRTADLNWNHYDSLEGQITECLFNTAHNVTNLHSVDDLKLKLANYDSFYKGCVQQDSSECLMLLLEIIDKGCFVCPSNEDNTYISHGDSVSEHLFSFIMERCVVCSLCGLRSPSFESNSILHVTPKIDASMQQLITQEQTQKMYKTCSYCSKENWHVESKYILQPPKYLHIVVNRFNYLNNKVTKNRDMIPLDHNLWLGPFQFKLQATVDHHGYSIHAGHYTTSIICCGKNFYCNDDRITECSNKCGSSTAYILLYKCTDNGTDHNLEGES